MSYRIINGKAYGTYNIGNLNADNNPRKQVLKKKEDISFAQILNKELDNKNTSMKISKHASERLEELGFNNLDYKNIEGGIEKARLKGATNTVIVYKNAAVIASVTNNTVITAVDKDRADDNVFTNIDSAVIL